MEIGEILTRLERLLETQNWKEVGLDGKIEVINVLHTCQPVLGPPAMEEWCKKVAIAFGLPVSQVKLLVDDPDGALKLLAEMPVPRVESWSMYPTEGWLGKHLKYTINNEAPLPFHFWVGVSVIGGALSRGVYFDKAHYRVYPNHFILLIAPSGRCRKSTAISIGVKLLRNAEAANILAEKITPEALIEALTAKKKVRGTQIEQDCSGFIHAPELAVFLGKQMYNEGLVALLTGLSDNPDKWEYRTRTKTTVQLTNVNISMLGASTPDWLYDSIPQSAFGGGFMSRILFVVQNRTDRIIPFPLPEDEVLKAWLTEKLKEYAELDMIFTNSSDGDKWYRAWYTKIATERRQIEDPKLSGYFERKPDHLIRLAMILAVSEGKTTQLTAELYERSLAILNTLEIPMPDAFVSVGESFMGVNARRVLKQLNSAGGKLDHSKLLQKNYRYMDKDQFRKCIDTLHEAGLVDKGTLGKKKVYILKNAEGLD